MEQKIKEIYLEDCEVWMLKKGEARIFENVIPRGSHVTLSVKSILSHFFGKTYHNDAYRPTINRVGENTYAESFIRRSAEDCFRICKTYLGDEASFEEVIDFLHENTGSNFCRDTDLRVYTYKGWYNFHNIDPRTGNIITTIFGEEKMFDSHIQLVGKVKEIDRCVRKELGFAPVETKSQEKELTQSL